MSDNIDYTLQKTRNVKNTNKTRRVHTPRTMNESRLRNQQRVINQKHAQWIKNFKRQQAIRRLMHCHPEQPTEEVYDCYDDDEYYDASGYCILERFD